MTLATHGLCCFFLKQALGGSWLCWARSKVSFIPIYQNHLDIKGPGCYPTPVLTVVPVVEWLLISSGVESNSWDFHKILGELGAPNSHLIPTPVLSPS